MFHLDVHISVQDYCDAKTWRGVGGHTEEHEEFYYLINTLRG
jgi:hypothetical protein